MTEQAPIFRRLSWRSAMALHASGNGAAAAAAAAAAASRPSALAALLAGHILRNGEIVLLLLKPSLWFIAFACTRFAAALLLLTLAAKVTAAYLGYGQSIAYVEAGVLLLAGRVMWAVLQWMGRVYVLTDMRIIRLSGVFTVDIFDCPLRKVKSTRVTTSVRERVCRVGTIQIEAAGAAENPGATQQPPVADAAVESSRSAWQTLAKPLEVHERIVAAINRAKQGPGIT